MAKISLSYPDTWLSISISIKNRDTWVEAFSGTMTEVGTTRVYTYDFTEVSNTDYVYVASVSWYSDISGTIYRDGGWLTIEEHNQLFAMWGGWIFKMWLNTTDRKLIKDTYEKVQKLEESESIIEEKLFDIDSHIEIAKTNIIDTINETETEVCSDIVRIKKELKEDNISTRQLIRQKSKKQEDFIQKQLDNEAKTQKMIDDEAEEIENALDMVDEEYITKAIQQADSEHEKNIIDALNLL